MKNESWGLDSVQKIIAKKLDKGYSARQAGEFGTGFANRVSAHQKGIDTQTKEQGEER